MCVVGHRRGTGRRAAGIHPVAAWGQGILPAGAHRRMACPLHAPGKAAERCCNNLPQAQTERTVTQMAYYRTCPHCGANLDPGEVCEDCRTTERDAHQPTKQCERPYTNRPPKRTVSPILHKTGCAVNASGKF